MDAAMAMRLARYGSLRRGFNDLGIGRIQARTHPDNVASQAVLERVGFQREGLARSAHVLPVSGERIDCIMWSLLPGELR
jgi:ribosomal-protein-alanine N-acetyltransferase